VSLAALAPLLILMMFFGSRLQRTSSTVASSVVLVRRFPYMLCSLLTLGSVYQMDYYGLEHHEHHDHH